MMKTLLRDIRNWFGEEVGVDFDLWVVPPVLVLAFLSLGAFVERFAVPRIKHLTRRTEWKGNEILLNSLKGLLRWFFAALALTSVATYYLERVRLQEPLNNIANAVLILVSTLYIARVAVGFLQENARKNNALQSASLVNIAVRVTIIILGGLVALQTVGLSITPLLTALGVGGLAVALALQPTLSNLFSGLSILITQKFRTGDYVEMLNEQQAGYITDITWRNVTLRTLQDNLIIIPNNKFADEVIKNFNFPEGLFKVPISVGVHYDSDLEQVERVTREVARKIQDAVTRQPQLPEPLFWYRNFGSSSIDFRVLLYAPDYNTSFPLISEFVKALTIRYREEGIEIPFPITNLYFRNALHSSSA